MMPCICSLKLYINANIHYSNVLGILNLWIGISFVTIFEVVELLYSLLRNKSAS